MHNPLLELGLVIALGIGAQWVGWRLRLPSILFLLLFGVLAGPVWGWVHPDALFGDLLMPLVSVCVGLILFEGGLSLRRAELHGAARTTWSLVSVGALITWAIATAAALLFLKTNLEMSLLLGAILIVTGPTVIGPLLLHVRPRGAVGPILKWEGILIDPVGAALGVLVFEAVIAGHMESAPALVAFGVLKTLLVGVLIGLAAAAFLLLFLERHWIPEHLQTPGTLALVVGAFVVSNQLQSESGLLTVTLMGIILANQNRVEVRHVIEFKENLRVVLLSTLFIILAARLDIGHLSHIQPGLLAFIGALVFVARPVAVGLCTLGSQLSARERIFLACVAPRGIIAAAIASVFALGLERKGFAYGEQLIATTFLVVASTVLFYGLLAGPLARLLGVSQPNPQGVLIVGAHPLARQLGRALKREGIRTILIDNNWANVAAARLEGIKAHLGNAVSEYVLEELDLEDIGHMIALTANNKVNTLAALNFSDVFGRRNVYQLAPEAHVGRLRDDTAPKHLQGRQVFEKDCSFASLQERATAGTIIKTTRLSKEFSYAAFRDQYGDTAMPLFRLSQGGLLQIAAPDEAFSPGAGDRVISLVPPLPY